MSYRLWSRKLCIETAYSSPACPTSEDILWALILMSHR